MGPLDITERLTLLARGDNLDLTGLVCSDANTEINKLRGLLTRAMPAIERYWGLTPGGPKKSAALRLLNEIRKSVPGAVDA